MYFITHYTSSSGKNVFCQNIDLYYQGTLYKIQDWISFQETVQFV